jgi:acyl-CoA hydrolase
VPLGAESPDAVVSRIASGMNVFVHGAAATPTPLLDALARRTDLVGVKLWHLHLEGPLAFTAPEYAGRFRSISLFTGAGLREPIAEGRADFVPIFLSDIPGLFTSGRVRLDAALVQLSPPDRHGTCSLGTSIDTARAAVDSAGLVLAEINDRMPRTHGHTAVPLGRLAAWTATDRDLPGHAPPPPTAAEERIGDHVAALVEDGACLQLGIGGIPNAVLARLEQRRDLGIHTEMFSDGVVRLIESGAVTNARKTIHPGRTIASFVVGSRRLYDFIDDTNLIRKIEQVVAINSGLEIDLTGQVCADSIGHRVYSGIGGQMDFVRGAAMSPRGKPIIALPSTAVAGSVSRIVAQLKPGAGVVTTRGHVHWVVTEHGAVNLHGTSLAERGRLLVSIAHPDHREPLLAALRDLKRG